MRDRERKHKSVLMGDGAYYHPKASVGSLDNNYRYLFLDAIEKRTPDVLKSLRHRIWPTYEAMHWRVVPRLSRDYWLYKLHPELVFHWTLGTKLEGWTPRSRRVLALLKRQLFSWSKKYQVHVDWMLMRALDTLYFWTTHESEPSRRLHNKKMAR
ncbi:MAG TPA: hypothetical protein VJM82_07990, partial [Nitrospiraceae bacterium]|nr:hypothetical protein [Nitrospiraceae bacterium]